jgi:hypothetical protein
VLKESADWVLSFETIFEGVKVCTSKDELSLFIGVLFSFGGGCSGVALVRIIADVLSIKPLNSIQPAECWIT